MVEGFRVGREIGRGGFSVVYEATQLGLERQVALKVINATGNEARRFEREARALGALSGIQFLVQAFAVTVTDDGRPVLVMPLMADTLARRIASGGRCDPADVARWAVQLAGALDGAHDRGVSHRDVKPENVLLSASGDAYLADLGIAALDGMASSTTTAYSLSPPHAPPERFSGVDADPIAGDVYSLASTLYAALAGGPPFGTDRTGGPLGLMNRVATQEPPVISGISPAANTALRHGLAKQPEGRPATAFALAQELAVGLEYPARSWTMPRTTSLGDQPTVLRSVTPAGAEVTLPGAGGSRRPAGPVIAVALLIVALLAAGGVLIWLIADRGSGSARGNAEGNVSPANFSQTVRTTSELTTSATEPATSPPITEPATLQPTLAPAPTIPATAAEPESIPRDVDAGAVEALFDQYLEVGSSNSVDDFAALFNYPVREYYEVVGASEEAVRAKRAARIRDVPTRSYARVGGISISRGGDLIVGTAQFHFDLTYADGRRVCGTNTLSIGFSGVDGHLGIATLREKKGSKGC